MVSIGWKEKKRMPSFSKSIFLSFFKTQTNNRLPKSRIKRNIFINTPFFYGPTINIFILSALRSHSSCKLYCTFRFFSFSFLYFQWQCLSSFFAVTYSLTHSHISSPSWVPLTEQQHGCVSLACLSELKPQVWMLETVITFFFSVTFLFSVLYFPGYPEKHSVKINKLPYLNSAFSAPAFFFSWSLKTSQTLYIYQM